MKLLEKACLAWSRITVWGLAVLLLWGGRSLSAQDGGAECIRRAQSLYDRGSLVEVARELPECLRRKDLSREKRAEGYIVLAQTYLFLDRYQEAARMIRKLLRSNPEFSADPRLYSSEFMQLVDGFRAVPLVSLGARGGLNQSLVEVITSYSVGAQEPAYNGAYIRRLGWNGALTADFYLFHNTTIGFELMYTVKEFTFWENPLPQTILSYREILNYAEVPLTLKYEFGRGRFTPYVRAGGSIGRLLWANKDSISTRVNADPATITLTGEAISITKQRNEWEYNLLLGAGLSIRSGFNRVIFEARYRHGMYNIVDTKNRFQNPQFQYFYYSIDDDFRLHNLELSIGYTHRFWKVRSRKRKLNRK
ncbi:MAG: porin family protein [Bacteroidota bacterium]